MTGGEKAFATAFLVSVIASIAGTIGVIWVCAHFIAKFW